MNIEYVLVPGTTAQHLVRAFLVLFSPGIYNNFYSLMSFVLMPVIRLLVLLFFFGRWLATEFNFLHL